VISLSWPQVNAWRLSQQGLSPHNSGQQFIQAVRQIGGIQAQVMSAAELAIAARVEGISPHHVQSALWEDRSLVKTWAMRAALHLITAEDFPIYISARSLSDTRNWPYYFSYYGIDQATFAEYLSIAPEILSEHPMTRQQFADSVAEHLDSPKLFELLTTKGWGTPLKPLAWRGDLCFGPNRGANVTFVRPSAWIGPWQPIDPYVALQRVLRKYLRAFGPATLENFAQWWSARIRPTRKLFDSMADELEMVDVEGWKAWVLRDTLEPMRNSTSRGVVNLLPLFDALLMGLGRRQEIEPLISLAHQKHVFRPQGWISAVVLVEGVWEYQFKPVDFILKIFLFTSLSTSLREKIAAEAERLGQFLNKKVSLEFSLLA
jgi:uncharacterized protein YcaQ